MIDRLMIMAMMIASSRQLWFKAFDKSSAEPFCFVDHMSQENDYMIKWELADVSVVGEDKDSQKPKETKPAVLYFNITKFKNSGEKEAADGSRKYIDHNFYDTSKAQNTTKGAFHFSVENGRISLLQTTESRSVSRATESMACWQR